MVKNDRSEGGNILNFPLKQNFPNISIAQANSIAASSLQFLLKRRKRLIEALENSERERQREKEIDRELSSRVRQQREINNPSFLMPRYRASSRLYNAAGARTSDGIVVSRTG